MLVESAPPVLLPPVAAVCTEDVPPSGTVPKAPPVDGGFNAVPLVTTLLTPPVVRTVDAVPIVALADLPPSAAPLPPAAPPELAGVLEEAELELPEQAKTPMATQPRVTHALARMAKNNLRCM